MFDSKGKTKTKKFLTHIQVLGNNSSERVVDEFQETKKELISKFIADTAELVKHNEWGIGLENLLSNLYEIQFSLDRNAVDLAKEAINECEMNYQDWKFIEELVKLK